MQKLTEKQKNVAEEMNAWSEQLGTLGGDGNGY